MTTKILKFKTCKKFQQNIWLSRKLTTKQKIKLLNLKKVQKKQSNFFHQLQARQLLSYLYGKLTTQYLLKLFAKSYKYKGKIANNFLIFLERRLDVCLYRLHFAPTLAAARQLIAHGKILVNNQIVKKSGFQLQPGDIFQCHENSMPFIKHNLKTFFEFQQKLGTLRLRKAELNSSHSMEKAFWYKPMHVEINYKILEGVFLFSPQQVHYPVYVNIELAAKAFQK